MLCNRIKQFREYNDLDEENLSQILGISVSEYKSYESGEKTPTIDIIEKLSICYKITVDEFYGYTPKISVYTENKGMPDEEIPESLLKMSDLSWIEAQLILHYRNLDDQEAFINDILNKKEKE